MTTDQHRRITDEGVARLDLHEGRAALLEEIMSSSPADLALTVDRDRPAVQRGPVRRWVPALGAAAAVVALAAVPFWVANEESPREVEQAPYAGAPAPGNGEIAVLDAEGWTLAHASIDEDGGELSYANESLEQDPDNPYGASFDISWYSANQYAGYVADREEIGESEDIEVLGVPARMWAYDPKEDHTAIREVVGDFMLEVRGSGIDRATYLDLLDRLRGVGPGQLDAHLPEEFVTDAERNQVIAEMLESVPLPDGFDRAIQSHEVDRYQLGAEVIAAVTCAWLDRYASAEEIGDRAAMAEVVDALATSRDWPVLVEMEDRGDYPEVVRQYADTLAEGGFPEGYVGGLGCATE